VERSVTSEARPGATGQADLAVRPFQATERVGSSLSALSDKMAASRWADVVLSWPSPRAKLAAGYSRKSSAQTRLSGHSEYSDRNPMNTRCHKSTTFYLWTPAMHHLGE
jgi:hypothetical protein